MKKVITAIGNPSINEILKKEKSADIICKDVQYLEAVLEILKIKKVDFLIVSDKVLNCKNLYEELKNIKHLQEKIRIIILVKNNSLNLENIKKEKNINFIFINKKTNKELIIEKINKIILNNKKNNNKNYLKREYVFIDSNLFKNIKLKKEIFFKNTKILLLINANLLGIEIGKEIINKLINNFNIKQKNIFIIVNNNNKNSIDMFVIKNCFHENKVIGKIKDRRKLWTLKM